MQEFGYKRVFVGLSNLKYIFTEDTYYTTNLVSSVVKMLWQVPVILVLSLFFALILNQKFHGRTFVRAVFFLPVILASGIILELINSDVAANQIMSGNAVAGGEITQSDALATLLTDLGLSSKVINFATNITCLIWRGLRVYKRLYSWRLFKAYRGRCMKRQWLRALHRGKSFGK